MIGGVTIWEIVWTIGLPHLSGLPHLRGVPHLHVDLYSSWTKVKEGKLADFGKLCYKTLWINAGPQPLFPAESDVMNVWADAIRIDSDSALTLT